MAATTMRSTTWLVTKLQPTYPDLTFTPGDDFRWSPVEQVIYFVPDSPDLPSLIHEVAHASLGHADYAKDIILIDMERDAWQYAREVLAPAYDIVIDDTVINVALDTYRDWLHARSLCPNCDATGIQSKKRTYKCLACGQNWRVNEARLCALRRYKLDTRKHL